jgi:hypothetical protein
MPIAATNGRLMLFAIAACLPLCAGATAQRTFVASNGVDNPTCSISAPCRGFAAAVAATSPNGEVIVVDSAGYGSVTITQPVSIIAPPGVYAGVSVFAGTDGITVSAGPTHRVVLRGLVVNGQGGNNGIRVTSGGKIHIEDCTTSNLGSAGTFIEGGTAVHMVRIIARANGLDGILASPALATLVTVTVADSVLSDNGRTGFFAYATTAGATVHATLSHVTSSGNASSGFAVNSGAAGTATVALADCISTLNNSAGIYATGANALAIVSGSSFAQNASPDFYQNASSVIRTAGDNAVTGTGGDIFGSLAPNPLK